MEDSFTHHVEPIEPTKQFSPEECVKILGNHCWNVRFKTPSKYDGKARTCYHCGLRQTFEEIKPEKEAVYGWK